jgi:hypothetical protein
MRKAAGWQAAGSLLRLLLRRGVHRGQVAKVSLCTHNPATRLPHTDPWPAQPQCGPLQLAKGLAQSGARLSPARRTPLRHCQYGGVTLLLREGPVHEPVAAQTRQRVACRPPQPRRPQRQPRAQRPQHPRPRCCGRWAAAAVCNRQLARFWHSRCCAAEAIPLVTTTRRSCGPEPSSPAHARSFQASLGGHPS